MKRKAECGRGENAKPGGVAAGAPGGPAGDASHPVLLEKR